MNKVRRVIRKTEPEYQTGFDSQFWPVVVALCLLAGFLVGAGMTLLEGPWLWLCMIGMPVGLGLAILGLACINNRLVRRSFQMALVLSLAIHVGFVIYAKRTDVFGSSQVAAIDQKVADNPKKKQKVRPRKIETFQWQQVNEVPTPERPAEELVEEREVVDRSTQRPQPTPIDRATKAFDPNVFERREHQRTAPRRGESLSKLSRADTSLADNSATGADQLAQRPASGRKVKSEVPLEVKPTAVERMASRSSNASKSSTASPQSVAAADISSANRERVTQSNRQPVERTDPSSRPAQRVSRSETQIEQSPEMPRVEVAQLPTENVERANPQVASAREVGGAINRQANQTTMQKRTIDPTLETPSLKTQQAMVSRREVEPKLASIDTSQSTNSTPRRAVMPQPTPLSPKSIENPRPSNIASSEANTIDGPGKLAISKSEEGIVGVGRSQNLDRMQVASKRPAWQPSNSADRQQAEQTQRPDLAFAPSKASLVPRALASPRELPTAVRAATASPRASVAAAKEPSTLQASTAASVNDAAADARKGELTASKGTAQVDIGPEKLVSGELTGRSSGGGQPEPNYAVANLGKASQKRSQLDASITVPNTAAVLAAPLAKAGSESTARESEPDSQSVVQSRAGGEGLTAASRSFSAPVQRGATDVVIESNRNRRAVTEAQPSDATEMLQRPGARQSRRAAVPDFLVETKVDPVADGQALATSSDPAPDKSLAASIASTTTERETAGIEADEDRESTGPADVDVKIGSSQQLARRDDSRSRVSEPDTNVASSQVEERTIERSRAIDVAGPGMSSPVALPPSADTEPVAFIPNEASSDGLPGPGDLGPERRRSQGGLAVDFSVPIGPGGLGVEYQSDAGIDDRRARFEEGPLQAFTDSRFVRSDPGGQPTVNTAAVVAADAFRVREKSASRRGGSPQTEEAIELGLDFLMRHQLADGNWTLTQFGDGTGESSDERAVFNSDTAATGLAVLAFQGAGYNHQEYKYATTIRRGIQWMLDHQRDDGCLYAESDEESNKYCLFYSHAIATLALCEAYGMTQDPALRIPTQEAIRYIENTQDKVRGGWRYRAGYSSDTSVTGWMMMALKSGDLAGLYVSASTYDGILNWLKQARVPGSPHLFRYNPYAPNTITQGHGRTATPTMTSVGLLLHLYFGSSREDQFVQDGADYILQKMPSEQTSELRDTYYWYYATQVLRHMDDERWERWSQQLIPLLRQTQIKNGEMAGSWHPLNPVPDLWGQQAGRLYQTTMNLLSLEVDYRLLRLYDDTVK